MMVASFFHVLLMILIYRNGASAHDHDHHHDHESTGRTLRQNRQQETFGFRGEFSSFEAWVSSQEFQTSEARCATKTLGGRSEELAAERVYQEWLEQNPGATDKESISRITIDVQTAWHIIERTDGSGGITQADVDSSMAVLNNAFNGYGFVFTLTETTLSRNDAWYTSDPQSAEEVDMKNALHRGDCSFLNLYSNQGGTSGSILGWAAFPWDCSANMTYDGVVINYLTVPGGGATGYNEGITLVHEVGHWLGLYHTFHTPGDCLSPGDYVTDTPPEFEPDFACDTTRISCDTPDSITNYMNYGPDSCLVEFSYEQYGRMHAQHSAFRYPIEVTPNPSTPSAPSSPTSPTPGGTPAPTVAPTAAVCFSEVATVPVLNTGPREMSNLQTGDKVLTARGYEPIYGFAHSNNNINTSNRTIPSTEFLQIHTQGQARPLEVSDEHLVFVVGRTNPIAASSIRPGDVLVNEEAGTLVTKVSKVQRNGGLYAPLTPSGTILVDGIKTSCYVSLQHRSPESCVELEGGINTRLSHHTLTHIWLTPIRIVCMGISFHLCQSFDSETGLASFVKIGFGMAGFMDQQHICFQLSLLLLIFFLLSPLWILEWIVGPELAIPTLLIGLVLHFVWRSGRIPFALCIVLRDKKKKID